jgi:hypothetical protein
VHANFPSIQVHTKLQEASQRLAAHPHQLLLPEPRGLSWADITLATAINKCMEMHYTQLPGVAPGNSAISAEGQHGKGSAPAGVTKAGASTAVVVSFMPRTQQLLQDNPVLVDWADATVRRYWPDGVSTLYKPVVKTSGTLYQSYC